MKHEDVITVLQELKNDGYGVLSALKEVRRRCGVDLGIAKAALAEHPAWAEARPGLVQSSELAEELAGRESRSTKEE